MIEISKGSKTALVFNAQNEVAKCLIPELVVAKSYEQIIVFDESNLELQHEKVVCVRWNPDELTNFATSIEGNDLFCFYDIDRPKNSSRTNIKVNTTYSYQIAKIALENKVNQFSLLSTDKASKDAISLNNRIRAFLMESLLQLPFWAVHFFCPTVVVNSLSVKTSKVLKAKFNNQLDKIKETSKASTEAELIAKVMVHATQQTKEGVFSYHPSYFSDFKKTYL